MKTVFEKLLDNFLIELVFDFQKSAGIRSTFRVNRFRFQKIIAPKNGVNGFLN